MPQSAAGGDQLKSVIQGWAYRMGCQCQFRENEKFKNFDYKLFLALILLAFTTRGMVKSAYLAHSPIISFIAHFDFAVSDRYSYEKMHTVGTAR